MALTVSADELKDYFLVMGVVLFFLIGLLAESIVKRREQILEDMENRRYGKKTLDNLRNCLCGCGVDRCAIYQKDLKTLEKTLEKSNCKHIKAIFSRFKADP
ncbi:hypothetical protein Bca4012_018915 [Brassica carinata]|uniref:Uncharacterized protein n=1 Tax=Brassica carinata TaxID=52824 RepID=A0A8X7WLP0_BRACI|nr:hypothetical protein Bca52824_002700 [Brassica carinata]